MQNAEIIQIKKTRDTLFIIGKPFLSITNVMKIPTKTPNNTFLIMDLYVILIPGLNIGFNRTEITGRAMPK